MRARPMRARGVALLCLSLWIWGGATGCGEREELSFLLLSDIHFDPFADRQLFEALQRSPAAEWPALFDAGARSGFAQPGSDSNYALLASSRDAARQRLPSPAFLLYGGDFLAHDWVRKYDALASASRREDPARYRAFTGKVLEFLAGMFRARFPDTPIFATLGNEDAFCGDYQLTPNGDFLGAFERSWGPLQGVFRESLGSAASLRRRGSYSAALPGLPGARLVVLNTVFFSARYANFCGALEQAPALDELRWLEETLLSVERRGEHVWLLMHVPPGIDGFETSRKLDSGGEVVSLWKRDLARRFIELVARHRESIEIAFAGHTHMDDYRLIGAKGSAPLLAKIAPAVSPIFRNDPGFQVYDVSASGPSRVLDFETQRLANLSSGGNGQGVRGDWRFEYRFRDAYGLGGLDAMSLGQLARALASEGSARRDYRRFYPVGAAPQFDASDFAGFRCAILHVDVEAFQRCWAGPKE